MTNRKIIVLAILTVGLFAFSAVNAADNLTDEAVGTDFEINEVAFSDNLKTEEAISNDDNVTEGNDVLADDDESDEIDIRASPATYKYSTGKVDYNFKIYNATSNTPISGARYYFDYSINDYPIEGVSDSNGDCVVKLNPSKIDGEAIIEVRHNGFWNSKEIKLRLLKVGVSAPTKTVYYKANKYFKATVKDWNGKPVKNLKVSMKVYTGKTSKKYKLYTDKNGVISFNTKSLKVGSHKVVLTASKTNYQFSKTSKIVVKKKPVIYKVTFKLKPYSSFYSEVKLKTGDILLAAATNRNGQHGRGVTIGTLINAGLEGQHSTKLVKGIVLYKNKNTGKIITKTQKETDWNDHNLKRLPWINGYVPYKAKVWYQKK